MSGKKERRQEYALRIMEALSGVEEDLLERCDEKASFRGKAGKPAGNKVRIWRLAEVCAAVLCLAAVGAASRVAFWRMGSTKEDSGGAMYSYSREKELEGAEMNGYAAPEAAVEEDPMDEMIVADSGQDASAGSKQESGEAAGGTDTDGHVQNDRDGAGIFDNIDQEDYSKEFQESTGLSGAETGEAMPDTEGCLRLNARNYTEEEARGLEEFAGYIPENLPAGYAFESAHSNLDLAEQNLTICWSRGMDLIMLSLSRTEGDVSTVDIHKPETYDERLYEIPFGETVPEEYREVFNNPTFAREDMGLEIIRSRMLVFEDAGDTAAPRGNFRVLYPDGMLLAFNGRGTAEEIWDMLSSLGE